MIETDDIFKKLCSKKLYGKKSRCSICGKKIMAIVNKKINWYDYSFLMYLFLKVLFVVRYVVKIIVKNKGRILKIKKVFIIAVLIVTFYTARKYLMIDLNSNKTIKKRI